MAMATCRVQFGAHHCDWVITEIEELVEIAAGKGGHDFLIVPIPDHLQDPGFRREGAYLTGYTKVGPMQVLNPTFAQCCR